MIAPLLSALLLLPADVLVFRGDTVLSEEVYRAVLELPKETKATPALALTVRGRLQRFLRRAGYDLAVVRVEQSGEQLLIDIDEGKLDKVLLIGEDVFQTLRLKVELSLPGNTFNRPMLERQLEQLAERYHLRAYRWYLAPVEAPHGHVGVQLEAFEPLQNLELIHPGRELELRIELTPEPWPTGFGLEVEISGLDGLEVGPRYRGAGLFFDDDRWELGGRVGATFRDSLLDDRTRFTPTQSSLDARWHTPPFVGEWLRSSLWLEGQLLNRQRADLGVDSFFYLPLRASLNFEVEPTAGLNVSLGGGVEHRRLARVRTAGAPLAYVAATPEEQTRPFALLRTELLFNADEVRRDHQHRLRAFARFFARPEESRRATMELDGDYQQMFRLGWHEIWLRSKGTLLTGDVLFPDERPIGSDHLRGPFTDIYVRRAASLGLELRYSLARDIVKLSLFHDLAAFGELSSDARAQTSRVADAFGLGLHVLILDAFQLDTYVGVGFSSAGRFDQGVVLELRQAF